MSSPEKTHAAYDILAGSYASTGARYWYQRTRTADGAGRIRGLTYPFVERNCHAATAAAGIAMPRRNPAAHEDPPFSALPPTPYLLFYLQFPFGSLQQVELDPVLCHGRVRHAADPVLHHQVRGDLHVLHHQVVRVGGVRDRV